MVAARIITDLISGRRNDWLSVYDARRSVPNEPVVSSVAAKTEADRQVGEDAPPAPSIKQLARESASVLEIDGKRVAVYLDEAGDTHKVSATCTHLGCEVKWNTAELTWDCPCHGSRFTYDGVLVQGPAVDDLPGA